MHNNHKQICIIGTDTNIGKTYITEKIIQILINKNKLVAGLKPIASGTSIINNIRINEDANCLLNANNVIKEVADINPICFDLAIAPHIASQISKYPLNVERVIKKTTLIIQNYEYDYMLIEGCGGLLVPLNDSETFLNLLLAWNYPVILVVGMMLGCLNHALLTYKCLLANNIPVLGWVANCIDPNMPQLLANIDYLTQAIKSPLIGIAQYGENLQPNDTFYEIFK